MKPTDSAGCRMNVEECFSRRRDVGGDRRGSGSAEDVDATVRDTRGANGRQSGESAGETSSMSVEYTFIKEHTCHDLSTVSLRVVGFSATVCGCRNVSRRGK